MLNSMRSSTPQITEDDVQFLHSQVEQLDLEIAELVQHLKKAEDFLLSVEIKDSILRSRRSLSQIALVA
jgi:hypothetical protein